MFAGPFNAADDLNLVGGDSNPKAKAVERVFGILQEPGVVDGKAVDDLLDAPWRMRQRIELSGLPIGLLPDVLGVHRLGPHRRGAAATAPPSMDRRENSLMEFSPLVAAAQWRSCDFRLA